MRFALINNERAEAKSGLKGICPGCSQSVIAKCGKQRINHWSHYGNKVCDNWWEPETDWHRLWKNNFPTDWQEVFLTNEQTKEKHVADICTSHGFIIEFQYSHIESQERISREKFYKNMLWVVDGTRLKRDYPKFIKGKENNFRTAYAQGIFLVSFPDECFPSAWIESSVPVIFDFHGISSQNISQDPIQNTLWCLFPGRVEGSAVVAALSREYFINTSINNPMLFISASRDLVNNITNIILQSRRQQENIMMNQLFKMRGGRTFRRYRRF
jgi:Competence protein